MVSIRERLVRSLHERLSAVLAPTPVLRQPATPLARDAAPALLLFAENERIEERSNRLVDRALTVRLVAVARGGEAFADADALLLAAHAALLADVSLGGLSQALRELDCDWEHEDADAGAVAQAARYEIRYRTLTHCLSQSG